MRAVVQQAGASGPRCPDEFADRYALTYRVAFRLTGDAERSARITRESLAAAGAALMPRAARVGVVRACRLAAAAALTEHGTPDVGDERARLRAAVRALASQPRAVFILLALAGVPSTDVESVLGLSPDWCASQLRVAEREVRAALGAASPSATPQPLPGKAEPSRPDQVSGPSRGRRQLLLAARGDH